MITKPSPDKTNVVIRVEPNGLRFTSSRGRQIPGYVHISDLVNIVETLDRLLDRWDGGEMEPAVYKIGTNA